MYCETLGARRPAKVAMAALSVEARTTSVNTQLRLVCNRNDVDEGGRAEHGALKWAGREPVGAQEWGGLEISEASTALAGLGGPFPSSVFMHVTRLWIAAIDWLATELPPMVPSLTLYMLGRSQGISFLMAVRDA